MVGGNPNPNQDQRGQFRAAKNIKTCAIQDWNGPTWMSLCRETEKNKGEKLWLQGFVLFLHKRHSTQWHECKMQPWVHHRKVQHSTGIHHYRFSRKSKCKTCKMFSVEWNFSLNPTSGLLKPEEWFKPEYSQLRWAVEVLESMGKTLLTLLMTFLLWKVNLLLTDIKS